MASALSNNAERQALTKASAALHTDTAEAAMRFAEYDGDGNQKLDFDEFYAMQPQRLRDEHSVEEIRTWFDAADTNGDGDLSIAEFFLWTLSNSAQKYGAASMEHAFAKYDDNGSGVLDAAEFEKMAIAQGFGAAAGAIFAELDENKSGSVTVGELQEALGTRQNALSKDTQLMLAQAMWQCGDDAPAGGDGPRTTVDTSKWKVTANDVDGIKEQLKEAIMTSGVQIADVLRLFDMDAGSQKEIDEIEFLNGMKEHFHYKGSPFVLSDVFSSIDTAGSGKIGFDELYELLRGKRHSLDRRSRRVPKRMPLKLPEGHEMGDIAWDVEALVRARAYDASWRTHAHAHTHTVLTISLSVLGARAMVASAHGRHPRAPWGICSRSRSCVGRQRGRAAEPS